ncbi:MAG TPA: hypothetical protein PLZ36_18740 [Armatimonadota bacterium]|nr:hypothetical protein [Armatimonadota bacterium]HOS44815.1 hypothetical protein [Armatimonadota bacterium]
MVTDIPSFIGYHPDDAEAAATALGLRVVRQDGTPPRWLSAHREPRVARQRLREDGALELLVVQAPSVRVGE